ncbi:hypothetical protein ACLDXX_17925, partial [Acinetobacter baumannii]
GYMRANWLCGRFCVQASSFENYIAEKPFTDRFVQQSLLKLHFSLVSLIVDFLKYHCAELLAMLLLGVMKYLVNFAL